jgi:hypothetical protein
MARARNIKPGFFKNEILGVADPLYSLLFEGLWVLADRAGKLEDRPLRIKGEVFPYRDGIDMESMLNWLQAQGFISRYAAAGKRYILVLEFVKHQNPHKNESASEIPDPEQAETNPEEIGSEPESIGSTRADSLSSDSGFRIPDSLIADSGFTDSLIPDLSGPPPAEDAPPRKAKPKAEAPTGAVWQAYASAYRARYSVEPIRNAMVNGQLAQVVARLGAEAAFVAEFYLTHKNRFYVEKMHPVGLLLQDAEKLRTEWATGRQVTATQAAQADKTQTNFNAFAPMLAEARAKEQSNAKH